MNKRLAHFCWVDKSPMRIAIDDKLLKLTQFVYFIRMQNREGYVKIVDGTLRAKPFFDFNPESLMH